VECCSVLVLCAPCVYRHTVCQLQQCHLSS
jgi:hypothetical protein